MPRARRSLQDSPGSLALVRLRCFLERKGTSPGVAYQRGRLPSCFSRCRFIMLGVQEGKEGKGGKRRNRGMYAKHYCKQ